VRQNQLDDPSIKLEKLDKWPGRLGTFGWPNHAKAPTSSISIGLPFGIET